MGMILVHAVDACATIILSEESLGRRQEVGAVPCGAVRAYLAIPNRFRKAVLFEFEIKESIRAQICKADNFRRLKIFRISVRTEVTH